MYDKKFCVIQSQFFMFSDNDVFIQYFKQFEVNQVGVKSNPLIHTTRITLGDLTLCLMVILHLVNIGSGNDFLPDALNHCLINLCWLPVHDDVIKWKHFPRYWPFVRGIHRSPVNSPHKGQWCGALMFSFICVWINGWVYNRDAGDLRCDHAHYDVIVMRRPRSVSAQYINS